MNSKSSATAERYGRKARADSLAHNSPDLLHPQIDDVTHRNTTLCVERLQELLRLFGFDDTGFSPKSTVETWVKESTECGWMKWAKYKLAAFFAYHTAQDLPKNPNPNSDDHAGMLFGGRAGRFIKKILSSSQRLSFLTSVLQAKKGFPRPSAEQVQQSVDETFVKLTTATEPISSIGTDEKDLWGNEISLTFDDLKTQCREVVREVFRRKRLSTDDLLTPFMPSTSANYNRTRSAFGTLGELRELGLLIPRPEFSDVQLSDDRLNDPAAWREEHIEVLRPARLYRLDNYDTLRHRFTKLYFDAMKLAWEEEPLVEPVGLPEALKVRVISKGPPLTYFCLKPIQKFMWKIMKDHPTFQLIGKPVTEDILLRVLGGVVKDHRAYLSGDYKAATDNLRWELTETVWEEFCQVCSIPVVLKELGLRALTQHIFVDKAGIHVPQKAGQLMGSIISFPILCLVNAAVCRWALLLTDYSQEGGPWKQVPLKSLPLLINGDDCAMLISRKGRDLWERIAAMAGLETSIGKTYFSDKFVNINSTNFTVEWEFIPDVRGSSYELRMTQVPYVNLGLLHGLKRSGGKVTVMDVDVDLASRQSELLKLSAGCVSDLSLHRLFLKHNQAALNAFSERRIPFYVPKQYGGVGLTPVGLYGPTKMDKTIVRNMVMQALPEQPVVLRDAAVVQLHALSQFILEESGVKLDGYWTRDLNAIDPLEMSPMYLWVLLHVPELAIQEQPEDAVKASLNKNARVWKKYATAYSMGSLPDMRPFDEIDVRRFVHDLAILYK